MQPGKKPSANKGHDSAVATAVKNGGRRERGAEREPRAEAPQTLEGSLVVLAKLKELEFHSRASLERLAELALTVENELKQQEIVGPLGEVYSAQSVFQTKLTTLIESYKAECDRLQGDGVVD